MAKGQRAINFKIEGGHKLSGAIQVNTSKNGAVALLVGALLNRGQTTLQRVPRIEEVNRLVEVLGSIGVKTRWRGNDLVMKPPARLNLSRLNQAAAIKTRSMIFLLGPLVHLFRRFRLPHPGGCALGERTIRPHVYALENLGVKITTKKNYYEVSAPRRAAGRREIVLYEASDTATENSLLAASRRPALTVIKFATANYMVQELCHFLTRLGVVIEGIGTSTLAVRGVAEINRPVTYPLSEDPIEAMLFLALAATTNSAIKIKRAPIDFLELELLKLSKMGFKYRLSKRYRGANGQINLADITTRPSPLAALADKIHPLPFPGINIDNLPFFVPIATQAKGQTLIHDWVYENRAIYYVELAKLGAKIILADPHRVIVEGPTPLSGAEVICPPALRPAAIILIAMLAAKGVSRLRDVYSINRGYEDLARRLRRLGAKISVF